MTSTEILEKIASILADVLDRDNVSLSMATVADDVDGWDSLSHVTLLAMIEADFKVKFTLKEMAEMKSVGNMVEIVARKTSQN